MVTRTLAFCLFASSLPAQAFDLQGHRGARGLAPENTLAAFRTALRIGVSTLELDVGVSRDGELLITHDLRLNPNLTRDAAGLWIADPGPPLNSLTLAELQRFDVGRLKPGTRYAATYPAQTAFDGEKMPTLAALFEQTRAWGANTVRFNIETKLSPLTPELSPAPEVFAQALVEVVKRQGMAGRVSVQSFDWRTLQALHKLAPGLPLVALTVRQSWLDNLSDGRWTGGLMLADHGQSVPRMVKALGASTWSPFHGELDMAQLREAQALGLKVIPWTVNDVAVIERLIGWGVDGLISDYPDRLRAALLKQGVSVPPALLP